ncbi:uncharacterized protein LOC116612238 isoform X2 [Nematostella vectensis]|uniref:uncharacterized protein LOC116612238 isoform X2 n=1 Tax=Nematostella vectensis TaxID=45351 RepID=UPI0020771923|nr:uncharacterized protein LOC116612238 isoform X2 [Nematostella vectensis]
MTILYFFLVFSILVYIVQGFPEIGFSADLGQPLQQSARGWVEVTGWTTAGLANTGRFHYGASLQESQSRFRVPKSGIYYVSTSLLLGNADNGVFRAAVILNGELNNRNDGLCGVLKPGTDQESSILFSGFAEFLAGDTVSIYAQSELDEDWIIKDESDFSLHYTGQVASFPAFFAAKTAPLRLTTGTNFIRNWQTNGAPGLFQSLPGFSSSTGEFIPVCDGVYFAAANIRVDAGQGTFILSLSVNGLAQGPVTEMKVARPESVFTLNLFGAFHIRRGDIVALQLRVNTADSVVGVESSFSVVRVNDFKSAALAGVSVVSTSQQKLSGSGTLELLDWPFPSNNHMLFANAAVFKGGRFTCTEGGVYFISSSLRIRGGIGQFKLLVLSSAATKLNGNGGLYTSYYNADPNGVFTLAVSGLLELSTSEYITINVISTFGSAWNIEQNSGLSIVKSKFYWPAFQAFGKDSIFFSSNSWTEMDSWKYDGVPGAFIFSDDASGSRFPIKNTGVYYVSTSMAFINSGRAAIAALIAVDGVANQGNGLYAIHDHPSENFTINIAGAVNLKKGQNVSVFVKCAKSSAWGLDKRSAFSVIYIGKSFAVPSFHAVFGKRATITTNSQLEIDGWSVDSGGAALAFQNGAGWTPERGSFFASVAGIYHVSCTLIVSNIADEYGSSIEITIGVTTRKSTTNGIQNTRSVYGTGARFGASTFTLTASGLVRLGVGDYVVIRAHSSKDTNWNVLPESGFSVFLVSPSTSSYDVAGFLSRKASNTIKNVAANTWEKVTGWSTNSDFTNGLFLEHAFCFLFESLLGDVTIYKSGVYLFSANLIATNTPFSFEAALRVTSVGGSTDIVSLFSAEKIPGSRDSYTLQFMGALYLTKGDKVHVAVRSGTSNQYTIHEGSGFSMTRIIFPEEKPGFYATITNFTAANVSDWTIIPQWTSTGAKGLFTSSDGFNPKIGRFTAVLSGTYFVFVQLSVNSVWQEKQLTMRLSINGENSDTDGLMSSYAFSNDSEYATLSAAGAVQLRVNDVVTIAIKSSVLSSFRITEGSVLSISYLWEREKTTGHTVDRYTENSFRSAGWGELINWRTSGLGGQFQVGSIHDTTDRFLVPTSGIYLLTANIAFRDVTGDIGLAIFVNDGLHRAISVYKNSNGKFDMLNFVMPLFLHNNTYTSISVYSSDTDWSISSISSKSSLMMESAGFAAHLRTNRTVDKYQANSWYSLTNWTITQTPGYFATITGFFPTSGVFVAHKTGLYVVSSNTVVISRDPDVSMFELLVAISGVFSSQSGLYSRQTLQGRAMDTINAFSLIQLQRWDTLTVVLRASSAAGFSVLDSTTFSVMISEEVESPALCESSGPTLTREISPKYLRTRVGTSVTWTCEAIGGVTPVYQWLKNYQVIPFSNSSVFSVTNGKVSDSGDYVCVAEIDPVSASSNVAKLTVYDPQPRFSSVNHTADVAENGPIGQLVLNMTLRAESKEKENADMAVSIIGGNKGNTFRLASNVTNGWLGLYTTRSLDRENISYYLLMVRARNIDEHAQEAITAINITVLDENDNKPRFEAGAYNVSVYENATIGTVIVRLTSTDADQGRNAHVIYNLLAGSGIGTFRVDNTTGEITLQKPLDREVMDFFSLFVSVSDPLFSAYQGVTIHILDVNEYRPVFTPQKYHVEISEASTVGTTLLVVTSTDQDIGKNAAVRYAIVDGDPDGYFAVNDYGVITLTKSLDSERNTTFNLTITAHDKGMPSLEAATRAIVVIDVVDTNDNNPIFELSLYETTILENTTAGSSVLEVRADDGDTQSSNKELRYVILGNCTDLHIDSLSGVIYTNNSVDYERQRVYKFQVGAYDTATPPRLATTRVIINVADLNDNIPTFDSPQYNISILESTPVGTAITVLSAKDRDSTSNAFLRYSIQSGNYENTFYLDRTSGTITLVKIPDFEARTQYTLVINVSDNGYPSLTSQTTLQIYIMDVNDNNPVFDSLEYTAVVWENVSVGTSVLRVVAVDRDVRNNAHLSYEMFSLGGPAARNSFQVNKTSGVIYTTREIDYEQDKDFSFVLIASDNGTSPRSAHARVHITVNDVNDNRPVFEPPYYQVMVSEHAPVGQTILRLTVSDNDTAENSQLNLRVVSGDPNSTFFLSNSGEISIARKLDYERLQMYNLTVVAWDSGKPVLQSLKPANVVIRIRDDNDNQPVFSRDLYEAWVLENITAGQFVVQVKAKDADYQQNGRLVYSMVRNNSKFRVNETTGEIYLSESLDFEETKEYVFGIIASDSGVEPKSSSTSVRVIVMDVNDNVPTFDRFLYKSTVRENSPVGTTAIKVQAIDTDTGSNAKIEYIIASGNTNNSFDIDNHGFVTVNKAIDFETRKIYNLTVMARDCGDPVLTSTVSVVLLIEDDNDNPPVFDLPYYFVRMYENVSIRADVIRVHASDSDSGFNSEIRYSFPVGFVVKPFAINANTGMIYTRHEIDFEEKRVYEFSVIASDQGIPVLRDVAIVRVDVLDVNDNPPEFLRTQYDVTVSEALLPGSIIVTLVSRDNDSTANGLVRFDILSGDKNSTFRVTESGSIILNKSLDYEQTKEYTLLLRARDVGLPPLVSDRNATVQIRVVDLNDHQPVFDLSQYSGVFMENTSVGSSLLRVRATDKDSDMNSHISYYMNTSQGLPFDVNQTNGEITLIRALDFETRSFYSFIVVASDAGRNRKAVNTLVQIYVMDINDNAPVFFPIVYDVTISEATLQGAIIAKVTANDNDSLSNAQLRFAISQGNENGSFAINDAGILILAHAIDFENTRMYDLTITVHDLGWPPLATSKPARVIIHVYDDNDNSPIFGQTVYEVTLKENYPVGQAFLNVSATDRDSRHNSLLSYSIHDAQANAPHFRITDETGELRLSSSLDYEARDVFRFTVIARDHGSSPRMGTTLVQVLVQDVNDNRPMFDPYCYNTTISENLLPGMPVVWVSAYDNDSSSNADLKYRISAGNKENAFEITATGQIRPVIALDHERTGFYNLTIDVRDSGQPALHAMHPATVLIHVFDVNDNAPIFNQTLYSAIIPEDFTVGGTLLTVLARDQDAALNARVTYSIVSFSTESDYFVIDNITGVVRSSKEFDYETQRMYSFSVRAEDRGSPIRSAIATIHVQITDTNDNRPIFQPMEYETRVSENTPLGTIVARVKAVDKDSTSNADLIYSIQNGNNNGSFTIDNSTGEIMTRKEFDFEKTERYNLTISVSDTGVPALSSLNFANVVIIVVDENDNPPEFAQKRYTATVYENFTVGDNLFTVKASDKDSHLNGLITYSITSAPSFAGKFVIDEILGNVSITSGFDFELEQSYDFVIEARDSGSPPHTAYAHAHVTILDVNDNAPVFPVNNTHLVLTEAIEVGTVVLRVTAHDKDSGPNAMLKYSIHSGNTDDAFVIIADSGDISLDKPLDKETIENYTLVLMVTDMGIPPLESIKRMVVNVIVSGVNEHAPRFLSEFYNASIPENLPLGTSIVRVRAVEDDVSVGARFIYVIKDAASSKVFLVNQTGDIILARELDYETRRRYEFEVFARDDGTPEPREGLCVVTISLLDINDNRPVFTKGKNSISISEDVRVGSTLVSLAATDADDSSNAQVSYSISHGDAERKFLIDNKGFIIVNDSLDFETTASYSLTIVAFDSGSPRLASLVPATVFVKVLDANDNPPIFNQPEYYVEMYENVTSGTQVLTLFAHDRDEGINGQVFYYIVTSSVKGVFTTNSTTGVVSSTAELDRESVYQYNMLVVAQDGGSPPRTASAHVKVEVLDCNDNPPVFTTLYYTLQLSEATSIGTRILRVSANDRDVGTNAKLSYAITKGNVNETFAIDHTTGELHTTKLLNREDIPGFNLTVTATDQGVPSLHTSSEVHVTILDSNDNIPCFTSPEYHVILPEDTPTGAFILQVTASDQDEDNNRMLRYFINDNQVMKFFSVKASSGNITLKSALDYESIRVFRFQVFVEDNGTPPHLGTTLVVIKVTDVNDNDPVFSTLHYTAQVSEASNVGALIAVLKASDSDSTSNAQLNFGITEGNVKNTFYVNTEGVIYLNRSLDFEERTVYNLSVTVEDSGTPKRKAVIEANVTIYVTDENDCSPVFSQTYYTTAIPENITVGSVILRTVALDLDSGINANLVYSIPSGNFRHAFQIDNSTSEISVNTGLDFEMTSEYNFLVRVQDQGMPPRVAFVPINFTIMDINDNEPKFSQLHYNLTMTENAREGTMLLKLQATDADSGMNAKLVYSILNTTSNGTFTVDPHTGVLRTSQRLDRETVTEYTLTITVHDLGDPMLNDAQPATVSITVLDENDNVPVFDQEVYSVSVPENITVGGHILLLNARDKDEGVNAEIRYFLKDAIVSKRFSINDTTGQITIKQAVDYEERSSYSFEVFASDGGEARLTGSSSVRITIIDVNDNRPYFLPTRYYVQLVENVAIGTTVTQVTASDLDSSLNGNVLFSILEGNSDGKFVIDQNTGVVTTNKSLDYEDVTKYTLVIQATDCGDPPLNSSQPGMLHVSVVNINDNSPVFSQKIYSASIDENTTVGHVILRVQATDRDHVNSSSIVIYSLDKSDTEAMRYFAINNQTGELILVSSLDYESTKRYEFTVFAGDNIAQFRKRRDIGDQARVAAVLIDISILDINDNRPKFLQSYNKIEITEGTRESTTILTLQANDADSGVNAKLVYSILNTTSNGTFTVDPHTGVLRTSQRLDRETVTEYTLTITVHDSGDPMLNAAQTATVSITVLDENDNVPVFDQEVYSVSIPENITVGAHILLLNAKDKDEGVNAEIRYFLKDVIASKRFSMNDTTGQITIKQAVDYEERSSYSFEVFASDGGEARLTGSSSVRITIIDVNDNRPYFLPTRYYVQLVENVAIGTTVTQVTASDLDSSLNGKVLFSILEGNSDGKFVVDQNTGVVTTNKSLDYEDVTEYTLVIQATDCGDPPLNSSQPGMLHVSVVNMNDNSPVFSQKMYSASIDENTTVGHVILRVQATDRDHVNSSSIVIYSLDQSDTEAMRYFTINNRTGELILVSSLDYESTKRYEFTVFAGDNTAQFRKRRDIGDQARVAAVLIDISILDINDNRPKFLQSYNKIEITEGTRESTMILTLQATDADSGMNAKLVYSILNTTSNGTFTVDPHTGVLRTSQRLDRETVTEYTLTITVHDSGDPMLNAAQLATVSITVLDENDNVPVFDQEVYSVSIPENITVGAHILLLNAKDKDEGVNAEIRYFLKDLIASKRFSMNDTTGQITIKQAVDYEERSSYSFEVFASDGGETRLTGSSSVRITIIDVNDNRPYFLPTRYYVQLVENVAIGTTVTQVTASDLDSSLNGNVLFSILEGNSDGKFVIDQNTGVVTTNKSLDYEDVTKYTLVIQATDCGDPPLNSSQPGMLHVSVVNINDNSPVFSQKIYSASIDENTTVGHVILRVQATDRDHVNRSSIVIYSLDQSDTEAMRYFAINNQTGELILVSSLDYESTKRYEFTVFAGDNIAQFRKRRDIRDQARVAAVLIDISILDINDNRPKFLQPYHKIEITEGTRESTTILTLQATDADSGVNAKLVYSILNTTSNGTFTVDPHTGVLRTSQRLDRETVNEYTLTITVHDSGDPMLNAAQTSTVSITVLDENDNVPVFDQEVYSVSIPENITVGAHILLLNAKDKDEGVNAEIRYFLKDVIASKRFSMNDTTGQITIKQAVDYEERSSYSFEVFASDGGEARLTGSSSVRITIIDVNDNRPYFLPTRYYVQLVENVAIGTTVTQVTASDLDSSLNGKVLFSILEGNSDGKFLIDQNTGVVTTNKSLDYEDVTKYTLVIQATDCGDPPLNSSQPGMLHVSVVNINDNSPVFLQKMYSASIDENTTVGHVILRVQATDRDHVNSSSIVIYSLDQSDTEAMRYFTINNQTGELILVSSLDYESTKRYEFTVFAGDNIAQFRKRRDIRDQARVAAVLIDISILDINDNRPKFLQPYHKIEITEGTRQSTTILTLQATDADSAMNAKLVYSILNTTSNGTFTVDPHTGVLRTSQRLDRETVTEYTLTITVHDLGDPMLNDAQPATVSITVLDENDNVPVFDQEVYSVSVPENITVGGHILLLNARDKDEGVNAEIRYFLKDAIVSKRFSINDTTGQITIKQAVDYEERSSYSFEVFASDGGEARLTGSSSVRITIIDVNDNRPYFLPTRYYVQLVENVAIGTTVTQVIASDLDSNLNGKVLFSILGGNSGGKFVIDQNTGVVTTNKSLDYEDVTEYTLVIQATDCGDPPLNSSQPGMLHVSVVNINDNSPVFSQKMYSVSIDENTTVGHVILRVQATDRDHVNSISIVIYSLDQSDTEAMRYFTINNRTGELILVSSLDYESTKRYEFTVFAGDNTAQFRKRRDIGDQARVAAVLIDISILDINDNRPKFLQSYNKIEITEGTRESTMILTLQATDADSGMNAKLVYSILNTTSNGTFTVDPHTGVLRTSQRLDRETVTEYTLTITVHDSGDPMLNDAQPATVSITVLDENDNVPVFDQEVYSVSVPENITVGGHILLLNARDKDEGVNAEIRYFLKDVIASKRFSMSDTTGQITIKQAVDYEERSSYSFEVFASDGGEARLTGSSSVRITIIDVNDNRPYFLPTRYYVQLVENVAIGTTVTQVTASDLDSSLNGKVLFSILEGNSDGKFVIDQNTGVVTTNKSLDYEDVTKYTLVIQATDCGDPPLNSSQPGMLHVSVVNINDNSPVFSQKMYSVSIDENTTVGHVILRVQATDQDHVNSSSIVIYSLDQSDTEAMRYFAINNQTGELIIASSLDYESTKRYEFTVFAGDNIAKLLKRRNIGDQDRVAAVLIDISILDINDNRPKFLRPYNKIEITEGTRESTMILTLQATDADSGVNAKLVYSILNTTSNGTFTVDPYTGVLRTSQRLDRETVTEYTLTITVHDSGDPMLNAAQPATVSITVLDENDNVPVFDQEVYSGVILIDWASSPGTIATVIQASDHDSGSAGFISYFISNITGLPTLTTISDFARCVNQTYGVFDIHEHTGTLRVSGILASSCLYNVTVTARDHGVPPLLSSVILQIQTSTRPPPTVQSPLMIVEEDIVTVVVVVCFFLVLLALLLCLFVWRESRKHNKKRKRLILDGMKGKVAADGIPCAESGSSVISEGEPVLVGWYARAWAQNYSSSSSPWAPSSPASVRSGTYSSSLATDILDTYSQKIEDPAGYYTITGPETQTFDVAIEFGEESDASFPDTPVLIEEPLSEVSSFNNFYFRRGLTGPRRQNRMYIPDLHALDLYNSFDNVTLSGNESYITVNRFEPRTHKSESSSSEMDMTYDAYRYDETTL